MNPTPKPAFSIAELRNGFEACVKNALRMLAAARKCLEANGSRLWQENHALGLALAVLALEEVGKFCLIDATLFSFENEEVVRAVRSSYIVHKSKLAYLRIWPLVMSRIVEQARGGRADRADKRQFAASVAKCRSITKRMESWIPGPDFILLDHWKQRGFYVALHGGRFEAPPEAVSCERAEQVVALAHAVVQTTVQYGLHNIDEYLRWAGAQRGTLTPTRLNHLRKALRDAADGAQPA